MLKTPDLFEYFLYYFYFSESGGVNTPTENDFIGFVLLEM
jgi:hypothetical protein